MKKYIKTGLMLCAACMALTSCNEDPEFFELKTYPDEMHIQCSVDEIILNKGNADQAAVTFTWDKVTSPISPDDVVTYKLCLYPSATKEQMSAYIETEDTQLTLTHDQLNSMVARWALPGEAVKVTAQVLSIVNNEQKYVKPEVSKVELTVTGYEKYPTYLYMVMTDEGGNVTTERMEQRQLGTGIYELTFNLMPCTFHFATSEETYPLYGMAAGGDGEQMEYVNEGEYTEFETFLLGQYTVIVDTNDDFNDCRVLDIVQLPTPGLIWICGNGCSIGWDTNAPAAHMEMTGSLREPYWYSWTGEFNAGGEIKIGLGGGWGDQFFYAPEANANPMTDNRLPMYRLQDNGGDLKWVIPEEGAGRHTFSLCLLASNMHIVYE